MKKVYQAKDLIEAQLFRDFLADHRMDAVVLGGYLAGAAGELPALQFPEVWVLDARDHDRARQLLDAFLEGKREARSGGRGWRCGNCGESIEPPFDICWRCGAVRD
jgi:hypothetical protein